MGDFVQTVMVICSVVVAWMAIGRMRKTPEAKIQFSSFPSVVRLLVYGMTALIVFGCLAAILFSIRTQIPALLEIFGLAEMNVPGLDPEFLRQTVDDLTGTEGRAALAPASVLAMFLLIGLTRIPGIKGADEAFRIWLSGMDFQKREAELIAILLHRSDFVLNEAERQANAKKLEKYEFYVEGATFDEEIETIKFWRRVAGLLRLSTRWEADHKDLFTAEQRAELEEIREQDDRKTRMALAAIRLMISQRSADDALRHIADLRRLESAPHQDREQIEDLEADVQASLSSRMVPDEDRPVRIKGEELSRYVRQIETYFEIENKMLFDRLVGILADAVCRHKRDTTRFTDELHRIGFVELDRFMKFRFGQIFIIALAVFVGLALGFLVLDLFLVQADRMPLGKVVLVFMVFLSAAICAIGFGCNRGVAERLVTPWAEYAKAVGASLAAFFVIHTASFILGTAPQDTLGGYLASVWHWGFFPFAATLALCWRGGYRTSPTEKRAPKWLRRSKDGAIVAAAMAVAGLLVIWGMQYANPQMFGLFFEGWSGVVMFVGFEGLTAVIGFVLGFAVLFDMRETNTFLAGIFAPRPTAGAAA